MFILPSSASIVFLTIYITIYIYNKNTRTAVQLHRYTLIHVKLNI